MSSFNLKLINAFLFAVTCSVTAASAQTNFPAADPRGAAQGGSTAPPATIAPGDGVARGVNGGAVRHPATTAAANSDPNVRSPARARTPARRKTVRAGTSASRGTSAATPASTSPPPGAPVTVVPPPAAPEYLVGQARVAVRGNQDPVIRLGLAQHGPTVIEFPAADNFFAVHPGGSHIVTYDESPTLATDHYLVFRAGTGFAAASEDLETGAEARASVSVQMQSGLFVTFLFYPVRDVSRMAHRCVVTYSREEVVAARRAAGLAVNLDGTATQTSVPPPVASRRVVTNVANEASAQTREGDRAAAQGEQPAGVELETSELVGNTARGDSNRRKRAVNTQREAQRALREALAVPARFNRWSAPVHGLSVAAIAPVDLDDRHRMTVVAVKNTMQGGLRLVAGGPDIDLQTLNEAGQIVQVRSVNRLHVETSTVGGAIPGGATIYYAVVYETPVLEAAQRVRLSIAQANAADQPASAELSAAK